MKIIDAQVHIWSKTVTPTTGLHRKVEQFTAEQLLKEMDEAGVDAALIHPPGGWDPDSNALAVEAARKYPERFAVMGQFALDVPDNRGLIHGWRNQPGMLGLRWPFLQPAQRKLLDDGAVEWLWPATEKEGLPLAMMGGMFLPKFRAIAERHPNLRLLIDHCGLNRHGQDAEAFVHLDELIALAKLPNVAVKATGAPHYSTQG
jgi:predicted TIM-barrel fold metal-dependent hydrolase